MCMRADKFTEDPVRNAPGLGGKSKSKPLDLPSPEGPRPCATLCERVVDFMDTYNEN